MPVLGLQEVTISKEERDIFVLFPDFDAFILVDQKTLKGSIGPHEQWESAKEIDGKEAVKIIRRLIKRAIDSDEPRNMIKCRLLSGTLLLKKDPVLKNAVLTLY